MLLIKMIIFIIMSNNKYFIKTGGLNEFTLNPNIDDTNVDVNTPLSSDNPLSNPQDVKVATPNVVGLAVKGTTTSTTATGTVPSKSALAGYEPVDNEKKNSEIIDKTPENSELNDPSKLKNDEPQTSEEEHPHQIQSGEVNKEHELEKSIETSPEAGVVDIEVDEKLKSENEKLDKLQSLYERYSTKAFLTMKQIMLLNEARKILKK